MPHVMFPGASHGFIMVKLNHDACNVVGAASRVGDLCQFPSCRLRGIFRFPKGNSFLLETTHRQHVSEIATEFRETTLVCVDLAQVTIL